MHYRRSLSSFTLIEMLIVIVIIGILASALIPRLVSVQAKARDTKRKADLRQIVNGLETYKIDKSRYPTSANSNPYTLARGCTDYDCRNLSVDGPVWITGMTDYMTSLPHDPIDKQAAPINEWAGPWTDGNYTYAYAPLTPNPGTYGLVAQLESKTDPDRCEVKQYIYAYISASWCGPYSKQIYEASISTR